MERKPIVRVTVALVILTLLIVAFTYADNSSETTWIKVISDECIYNDHNHAAFTSLADCKGNMIVAIREASFHREIDTDNGKIRVLQKTNNS